MTALNASGKALQTGAVDNQRLALKRYFRQFRGHAVQVAVEACGFWPAFREVVEPEVERLLLVHPQRVRAIASAKLKKDRVDSATLAPLLRCDLLPESWQAGRPKRGGSRFACGPASATADAVKEPGACGVTSAGAVRPGNGPVRGARTAGAARGNVAGAGTRNGGGVLAHDRTRRKSKNKTAN